MGFVIFVINISIHNHSSKKFGDNERWVVVFLLGARGTKQHVHGTRVFIPERIKIAKRGVNWANSKILCNN